MADEQNDVFSTTLDSEAERKEPRLVAFLFAEWVSVTKDEKPVIAGVYDRLFVPLADPPFKVEVNVYARTLETHQHNLDLMMFAPDGKQYAKMGFINEGMPNPASDRPNVSHSIGSFELMFTQYGTYWFEIASGGKILGRIPLNVYEPPAENPDDSDSSKPDVPSKQNQ